jgi:hypothetical protein
MILVPADRAFAAWERTQALLGDEAIEKITDAEFEVREHPTGAMSFVCPDRALVLTLSPDGLSLTRMLKGETTTFRNGRQIGKEDARC